MNKNAQVFGKARELLYLLALPFISMAVAWLTYFLYFFLIKFSVKMSLAKMHLCNFWFITQTGNWWLSLYALLLHKLLLNAYRNYKLCSKHTMYCINSNILIINNQDCYCDLHLHYMYAFCRSIYPKQLKVYSGYTFFFNQYQISLVWTKHGTKWEHKTFRYVTLWYVMLCYVVIT